MAKSALERFNAYMNGMDPDTEAEAPEAEINIDVDVKITEAEDLAEENAALDSELEANEAATDMAEEAAEQAEMVAKILREEGLTPGMLSLLKVNPIFSDVWNVPMPARESLDATGTNMAHAKRIAAALEEKADATKGALAKAWDTIISWFAKLKTMLKEFFDFRYKRVQALNEKLGNIKEIDEEAGKSNKAMIISIDQLKDLNKYIDKLTGNLGLGSKILEFFNKTQKPNMTKSEHIVNDIYKHFKGANSEYYKLIDDLFKQRETLDKFVDDSIKVFKEYKRSNPDDKSGIEERKKEKKARSNAAKELKDAIKLAADCFIAGATAVISCEKKADKADKKEEKKD